jgi:hypothetical protein
MQYIKNLNDEPKTLPSQIGATVINNPSEEVVKALGLIPITGIKLNNPDNISDGVFKQIWSHNEILENTDNVIAVYNIEIDQEATRQRVIQAENARYKAQLEEGYTTATGINLPLTQPFRAYLTQIYNGVIILNLPDEAIFDRLRDSKENLHTITVKELKEIAIDYITACMQTDALNDYNLNAIINQS